MNSDSLKVYLALTTNVENVLLTTRPIVLLPGMNLVGVADLRVRQRLKARELSTFGLLDVSSHFSQKFHLLPVLNTTCYDSVTILS
jgi:hypothetical protein